MKGIMFNEHFGLESAVLSGRKTQTRRIIKCPSKIAGQDVYSFCIAKNNKGEVTEVFCIDFDERPIEGGNIFPPYQVGEDVAIKQSYETIFDNLSVDAAYDKECFIRDIGNAHNCKEASDVFSLAGSTNKMFVKNALMPHRIKITSIRIERLQDISEEDCLKEGISRVLRFTDNEGKEINEYTHPSIHGKHYYTSFDTPQQAFASLIDKVSGKGTFESNPYVWVIDFELLTDKTE